MPKFKLPDFIKYFSQTNEHLELLNKAAVTQHLHFSAERKYKEAKVSLWDLCYLDPKDIMHCIFNDLIFGLVLCRQPL